MQGDAEHWRGAEVFVVAVSCKAASKLEKLAFSGHSCLYRSQCQMISSMLHLKPNLIICLIVLYTYLAFRTQKRTFARSRRKVHGGAYGTRYLVIQS